jgi:predicted nucleic acid-binding Zn finger protein
MVIQVSTSDPRSVKALAILEGADRWTRGHRKSDGRSCFVIPSATGAGTYWADVRECTCPDFTLRGITCKHITAVRLWVAREQAERTRRARVKAASKKYEELYPDD